MRVKAATLAILIGALAFAPAATASPLANRCKTLKAKGFALRAYLKPTGLGRYMLYDPDRKLVAVGSGSSVVRVDAPGPAAEWAISRHSHGRFVLRSSANRGSLAVRSKSLRTTSGRATLFRVAAGRGCPVFPEAELNARGKPYRGPLGYADAHVHVTADLRAGGQVVSGESFDRFGITEALGHDADVHGSDGSLDITGNLLRSGNPAGTHDTHGWPSFSGWPTFDTYTHQQVYYRWLQRAWLDGMRLIVAQTVEDEPLCNIEPRRSHSCDETATIELQVARLKALQNYVDAQSGGRGRGWFRLVYSPAQALRAIRDGKLAVVIGVESSNPFGCSEFEGQPKCDRAAIDRGIARMKAIGVRTMFLAHWVDNALAGAALEEGDKGSFIGAMQVAQTGHSFVTGPCPHPEQGVEILPGTRVCNTKGLTDLGAYAIQRMIDNRMLIEADHLSESAREQFLAIAEQQHYPVVSSHTGTGGVWDPTELRRLYAGGGFASATIDGAAALTAKIVRFRQYTNAKYPAVGLGSDTGGFNALPAPDPSPLRYPFRSYLCNVRFDRQRTGSRTFDLSKDGVAHYGLVPDLLADVRRQPDGRAALDVLSHSAEGYVRTWALATNR